MDLQGIFSSAYYGIISQKRNPDQLRTHPLSLICRIFALTSEAEFSNLNLSSSPTLPPSMVARSSFFFSSQIHQQHIQISSSYLLIFLAGLGK